MFIVNGLMNIHCSHRIGVTFGIKATLLSGVIVSIVGFVIIMGQMSTPEKIGPNLAVMVLTLLYSFIISLFMLVIKGRLQKIIED